MKTKVQYTSIESFFQQTRNFNRRERQLYEVLKEIQPASDRDLAYKLDWEPNMVTGRRNSLVEKGVVEEAFRAKSTITKRRIIYWRVKDLSKAKMTTSEANQFLKGLA